MKSAFKVILLILIIIFIGSSLRPFWTKYWLGEDVKAAAIYGTKNSIEDTKKLLIQKMKESGRDFGVDNLTIEKNKYNTVTIRIAYTDKISFFGIIIKTIEFTLKERVFEVEEKF